MITKVSTAFLNRSSNADLLVAAETILAALKGNPNYLSPVPALADVQTAHDAFAAAIVAAAGGGVVATSTKNDRRDDLTALLRTLAVYVQLHCNDDLTTLLTSGFPIQKPQRQPVGPVATPANLSVGPGAVSGELNVKFPRVFGASIYNWRISTAATPTVWENRGQTTAASTSLDGLTPGVVYLVQANAVGTAGPSDWSNPASQMAL